MMTALATVVKVTPHDDQYSVDLSCEQKTSCNSCASQKSCGTGIVTKAVGNKELSWHLDTKEALKVGQVVEIGLPENSLIQSASLVYLMPLLGLIIGAVLGQFIFQPLIGEGELAIILSALVFGGIGMMLAKHFAQPLEKASKEQVTLVRVLGEPIL